MGGPHKQPLCDICGQYSTGASGNLPIEYNMMQPVPLTLNILEFYLHPLLFELSGRPYVCCFNSRNLHVSHSSTFKRSRDNDVAIP